ncbi:uncharacterized protein A4U43_C01F18930 [Asparagus officinalis]|uniref:Uncharacterized protein n=1 Tax=Asparagus officinalis TaxID=4686 RepID=A0A5P1FSY2_ASPOF|nr:uncharacterized protein A4U43_C01F18930 [Asparagus officinalis]
MRAGREPDVNSGELSASYGRCHRSAQARRKLDVAAEWELGDKEWLASGRWRTHIADVRSGRDLSSVELERGCSSIDGDQAGFESREMWRHGHPRVGVGASMARKIYLRQGIGKWATGKTFEWVRRGAVQMTVGLREEKLEREAGQFVAREKPAGLVLAGLQRPIANDEQYMG